MSGDRRPRRQAPFDDTELEEVPAPAPMARVGRRPASPYAERSRRIDWAKTALAKAAGALADPPLDDALAFAVLETAIALMHLGAADFDHRAKTRVEAVLRHAGGRSGASPNKEEP